METAVNEDYLEHGNTVPSKRTLTPNQEEGTKAKRTRGRSGCLNCRRRRKKCDEVKPSCGKCIFKGETCSWDTGLTFRWSGLDAQHPSMLLAREPKQSVSGFKIVDVQFETPLNDVDGEVSRSQTIRLLRDEPAGSSNVGSSTTVFVPDDPEKCVEQPRLSAYPLQRPCDTFKPTSTCIQATQPCESADRPKCQAFPYAQANPADVLNSLDGGEDPLVAAESETLAIENYDSDSEGSINVSPLLWSAEASASSATSGRADSNKASSIHSDLRYLDEDVTSLEPLEVLIVQPSLIPISSFTSSSSAAVSAYAKSTTKLNSNILAVLHGERHGLPGTGAQSNIDALQQLDLEVASRPAELRLLRAHLGARPLGCTKLLKRRQLELWRNFIDKIAPSLDICNGKKTLQQRLPILAKSADYLHYAVLALSARHIELRTPGTSFVESNDLYQDAVNLLSDELHALNSPVAASSILLCAFQLISSDETAAESMKACAGLLVTAHINARSTGVDQALYWAFANLTLAASAIDKGLCVLSVSDLFSGKPITSTINHIRASSWGGDGHVRYAIFLSLLVGTAIGRNENGPLPVALWKTLFELIEDWYECRPEETQPLMSYPSILDDHRHPFPLVLYGSVSAVMGNLLYHSASIELAQHKPDSIEAAKMQKPIHWHARQICGIVAEIQEQAVLGAAARPLLIAEAAIHNQAEHELVVEMMLRIERSTAWKLSGHVEALKAMGRTVGR